MNWPDLLGTILCVGGIPLLFLLALGPWIFWSVARGLKLRSRRPWKLEIERETLHVSIGSARIEWPLGSIRRARHAQNSNWTESTFVEDALTLYGADGKTLKLPASADGFRGLLAALRYRKVPIADVDVSAPAFLD